MANRVLKADVARRIAERMRSDEKTATVWLDAMTETLYEAISAGESVTLPGFGGFYVRPERDTWVFKFNPAQRLRAVLRWSSTFKGEI